MTIKAYGIVASSAIPPPAKPTGLVYSSSINPTAQSFDIEWDDAADVVQWTLYLNGAPFGLPISAPEASFSGLTPSTTYNIQVQAFNQGGASPLSDVFQGVTEANSLPVWSLDDQAFTVGQAVNIPFISVCTDFDSHPLTFSIVSGSVPGVQLNSNQNGLTGTVTTAGNYSLVLRANDGYGTSDTTVAFAVQATADITPPTNPGNYTIAVNGSTLTHAIGTPSTDPSGIAFYRFRRAGIVVSPSPGVLPADLPFVESGVPNGSYLCEVRAFDNSPAQNFTPFITGTPNPVVVNVAVAPDVPILATPVAVGSTQINNSWAAGPNGGTPTLYRLERSLTGANAQTAAPGTGGWTSSFAGLAFTDSDTGLTASTQYFFRLRAEIGALVSAWDTDNATTLSGSALIIPQGSDAPPWPHGAGSMSFSTVAADLPGSISRLNQWETWMGHPMEVYTEWTGQQATRSWTDIDTFNHDKVKNAINFFENRGRHTMPIVIRTLLMPNDGGLPDGDSNKIVGTTAYPNPTTWDRAANGQYTIHWTRFAQACVAYCAQHQRNPNTLIWSLGWEFTGNWYPHAMGTKVAEYKQYFKLVVQEIRRFIPGARIDWPPARPKPPGNPTLASIMPDPQYIDFISRSGHDGPPGNSPSGFAERSTGPASMDLQINGTSTHYGWNEFRSLCLATGKKLVASEWASQWEDTGDSHGPSPDPAYYYEQMYDRVFYPAFQQNILAYDTLFQPSRCAIYGTPSDPPTRVAASAAFKQRWKSKNS